MSVTLRPETETLLRERAHRTGMDLNTLADTLLTDALADDPDNLTEDEMAQIRAGIQRGLDAAAEGRVRSAEEYKADVQKRRAERQAMSQPHG